MILIIAWDWLSIVAYRKWIEHGQGKEINNQQWNSFYFQKNHYAGDEGIKWKTAGWTLSKNVWTCQDFIKANGRT